MHMQAQYRSLRIAAPEELQSLEAATTTMLAERGRWREGGDEPDYCEFTLSGRKLWRRAPGFASLLSVGGSIAIRQYTDDDEQITDFAIDRRFGSGISHEQISLTSSHTGIATYETDRSLWTLRNGEVNDEFYGYLLFKEEAGLDAVTSQEAFALEYMVSHAKQLAQNALVTRSLGWLAARLQPPAETE